MHKRGRGSTQSRNFDRYNDIQQKPEEPEKPIVSTSKAKASLIEREDIEKNKPLNEADMKKLIAKIGKCLQDFRPPSKRSGKAKQYKEIVGQGIKHL